MSFVSGVETANEVEYVQKLTAEEYACRAFQRSGLACAP
jgi:hypothetical protein